MKLLKFLKNLEPDKKKSPFMHTAYDAFFTFAFTPNTMTSGKGVHVRDKMDLKRTMVHVVLAMQFCLLFGILNIGQQHFAAIGAHSAILDGLHLKLVYGLVQMLPIIVVAHVVGLGVEFFYAAKKGHAVEEGFLVSGMLIPLIMPPDIPLWILALATAFAVIVGKEAFGGTGMNILNVALLARVFIFFAYPTTISGDEVWISGLVKDADTLIVSADYGWQHTMFDNLFQIFDWPTFTQYQGQAVIDGYTGATPLALAKNGGWEAVTEHYSSLEMLFGTIPGSIGETSKILVIVGVVMLIVSGIASWRIMLSMFLGAALTGMLLNAWGFNAFMEVPWYNHFLMGSLLFAMAFMATDPVTAASTNTGKWIYGFLIGSIGLVIRVLNPAYPEGWMLAILLLNVFAPLIDHYVVEANISKRLNRAKS